MGSGGQGGNRTPTVERRLIYSQRSSPPAQPTHDFSRRVVLAGRRPSISDASRPLNRDEWWSRGWESNPQPSVYKLGARTCTGLSSSTPCVRDPRTVSMAIRRGSTRCIPGGVAGGVSGPPTQTSRSAPVRIAGRIPHLLAGQSHTSCTRSGGRTWVAGMGALVPRLGAMALPWEPRRHGSWRSPALLRDLPRDRRMPATLLGAKWSEATRPKSDRRGPCSPRPRPARTVRRPDRTPPRGSGHRCWRCP